MKQDDIHLTQLKYIGATRMKLFNDLGITTIKQIYEMPVQKLAGIKSIGHHYATLIKNSVNEHYTEQQKKQQKEQQKELSAETVSANETKVSRNNRDSEKKINRLDKSLFRLDKSLIKVTEKLKPLWNKKYLGLYVNFKVRTVKLNARLEALDKMQEKLPGNVKNNIIKKTDALNITLKGVKKKLIKKKKYKEIIKEITKEIQSFSKMIDTVLS